MQTTSSVATLSPTVRERVSHYIELTKPRILVMILLTVIIAMVATGNSVGLLTAIHACVGTALVAASASVLNQWLERERDAVMTRTSKRPIPMGRIASSSAAWMGWLLFAVGSLYLAVFVNQPTMWCGFATWALYVWIYTPLKTFSWTNTLVGTIPGALPIWMGWTAAGGSLLDPEAWYLLGVVVAWQLPHFMAIAWLYREQYASAGYKMITVTDPSLRGAALHAILGAIALIVFSALAVPPISVVGTLFTVFAIAVSVWQLWAAIRFVRGPERATAKRMLHVSLLHLPLIMLLVLLSKWLA